MFKNLNPRSAEIIEQSSALYNLKWKGNIEFLLYGHGNSRSGWYYILKNNEQISLTYHYSEINDIFFQKLQKIIDDIESGKYNNKKTPSEKIRMIVEEDSPVYYWTMAGDEHFEYLNMTSVEWFKISCEIKEIKNRGRLIEDKFIIYDKKAEIYKILHTF